MKVFEPILAGGFVVTVIIFAVLEVGRWRRPDLLDVLTPMQKTRRGFGILLLLVLGLMAFGGSYWPDPTVVPLMVRQLELLYWLLFLLLTVFVPLIAFFEFKDSIHRASKLRREAYREIVTAPLESISTVDDDDSQKSDQ